MPSTGIHSTQFIEEPPGAHVWATFKSSAHQRPHKREGVLSLDVTTRIFLLSQSALAFDLRIVCWPAKLCRRSLQLLRIDCCAEDECIRLLSGRSARYLYDVL